MKYEHIIAAIASSPWAIRPEKLEAICEFVALKAAGVDLPAIDAEKRVREDFVLDEGGKVVMINGAAGTRTGAKGVAVLPIYGTITQRADFFTKASGGTSTEQFTKLFRAALKDPEVGSIVLDVDSPGGSVFGVQELGQEIYDGNKEKRVVAVANSEAASAAYWIASQAGELVVTPSGEVGSIGVIATHEDWTKNLESKGIKVSMITAGKYKGEGWPYKPLTEDGKSHIQARVDEYYDAFVKAVARGRGVAQKDVRSGFGEGRMVSARGAVALGMADDIATLDDVIADLLGSKKRKKMAAADLGPVGITVSVEERENRLRILGAL